MSLRRYKGYSVEGRRTPLGYELRVNTGKRTVKHTLPLNVFDRMTDAEKLAWLQDTRAKLTWRIK